MKPFPMAVQWLVWTCPEDKAANLKAGFWNTTLERNEQGLDSLLTAIEEFQLQREDHPVWGTIWANDCVGYGLTYRMPDVDVLLIEVALARRRAEA